RPAQLSRGSAITGSGGLRILFANIQQPLTTSPEQRNKRLAFFLTLASSESLMKFFNAFTHSIVAGSLLVACQVVASPLDETVTTIASINETLSKIEQRPNRADDELTLEVKNGQLYLSSHNKRINENTWS